MTPACPRCRTGDVLAVLRLPHIWTNASGNEVRGISEVLLCARCDAGDPLVASFTPPYDPDRFVRALLGKAAGARPPEPDEHALRAEAEAWYRGEL
ncbi:MULTISPECIES: DUF6300 family protein [Nonomuraea]|uniref:DUF6300 family protein n=2 Tax=Nonomuraea TaxID=83681 RepID=A0ABW1C2P0_9ACTN|nr:MULTISPECIES: DUF6300 family protein [Nonomuraea]MDA0642256.1 DUF6300 family protein [Nonomuraea ferruginea]TXK34924.1 hypothetical protein FR742_37145 [Nonomuraea sp. C10]